MRIARRGLWAVLLAAGLLSGAAVADEKPAAGKKAPAAELSPEQTVKEYLQAMKDGEYRAAYRYVSKAMAHGKSEEEWAKEQQWVMQVSEAKIFSFKVFPAKVEDGQALVPNILSSQDKFLNQLGVEEHEIYTLIREDGRWKIEQQTLVEPGDKEKWFPATES